MSLLLLDAFASLYANLPSRRLAPCHPQNFPISSFHRLVSLSLLSFFIICPLDGASTLARNYQARPGAFPRANSTLRGFRGIFVLFYFSFSPPPGGGGRERELPDIYITRL